jgi:hypothetical protein
LSNLDGGIAVDSNKFTVQDATGNTAIAGTLGVGGDTTLTGDLAVNGGDLTTSGTSFNLLNATATTVNAFGAATTIDVGSTADTAVINLNSTKEATSSTVGAVVVDGGLAVAKKAYVGTDLNVGGSTTLGDSVTVDTTAINGVTTINGTTAIDTKTFIVKNSTNEVFSIDSAGNIVASSNVKGTTLEATTNNNNFVQIRNILPVVGDQWFDKDNNLLFTYDDEEDWGSGVVLPVEEPQDPTFGTRWFDTDNNLLFTYDGEDWDLGVLTYIMEPPFQILYAPNLEINGDNLAITGTILYDAIKITGGGTPFEIGSGQDIKASIDSDGDAVLKNLDISGYIEKTAAANDANVDLNIGVTNSGTGTKTTSITLDSNTTVISEKLTVGTTSSLGGNVTLSAAADLIVKNAAASPVDVFTVDGATGDTTIARDLSLGNDLTLVGNIEKTGTVNNGNVDLNIGVTNSGTGTKTTSITLNAQETIITGKLTVDGTTTTLNARELTIDDKNIELGSVIEKTGLEATLTQGNTVTLTTGNTSGVIPGQELVKTSGTGAFGTGAVVGAITSATQFTVVNAAGAALNHATAGSITFSIEGASDASANGGGITLKGTTDKTIIWNTSGDRWDFNKGINVSGNSTVTGTSTFNNVVVNSSFTLNDGDITTTGTLTAGASSFGTLSVTGAGIIGGNVNASGDAFFTTINTTESRNSFAGTLEATKLIATTANKTVNANDDVFFTTINTTESRNSFAGTLEAIKLIANGSGKTVNANDNVFFTTIGATTASTLDGALVGSLSANGGAQASGLSKFTTIGETTVGTLDGNLTGSLSANGGAQASGTAAFTTIGATTASTLDGALTGTLAANGGAQASGTAAFTTIGATTASTLNGALTGTLAANGGAEASGLSKFTTIGATTVGTLDGALTGSLSANGGAEASGLSKFTTIGETSASTLDGALTGSLSANGGAEASGLSKFTTIGETSPGTLDATALTASSGLNVTGTVESGQSTFQALTVTGAVDVTGDVTVSANSNLNVGGTLTSGTLTLSSASPTLDITASGAKTANFISNTINATATSSTNSRTKTGLNIQSTGTWDGTSSVNRALLLNATGGTTNRAIEVTAGTSALKDITATALTLSDNNITINATSSGSTTNTLTAAAIKNFTTSTSNLITKTGLSVQSINTWNGANAVNRALYIEATGGTINKAIVVDSGDTDLKNLTVNGDLTVNGTTITLNTNTLTVDDKNIELGSVVQKINLIATLETGVNTVTLTTGNTSGVIPGQLLTKTAGVGAFGTDARVGNITSSTQFTVVNATGVNLNHTTAGSITFRTEGASDASANGGGITLKGTTDKTIIWSGNNSQWNFNQGVNITGNLDLSGNFIFTSAADREINIAALTTANTAGKSLTLKSGLGNGENVSSISFQTPTAALEDVNQTTAGLVDRLVLNSAGAAVTGALTTSSSIASGTTLTAGSSLTVGTTSSLGGDVTFTNAANRVIDIAALTTANTAGKSLTLKSGLGNGENVSSISFQTPTAAANSVNQTTAGLVDRLVLNNTGASITGNISSTGSISTGTFLSTTGNATIGGNIVLVNASSVSTTSGNLTLETGTTGQIILNGKTGTGSNSGTSITNDLYISGNLYFPSDERLKDKQEIISSSVLDGVLATDIWKFAYKIKPDQVEIGVMAQELERNFPELAEQLVSSSKTDEFEDQKSLKESKLVYVLWAALQEETKKRKELEEKINKIIEKLGE